MKLEILSFTWNLFKSDTVTSVTAMTGIWEVTILKDHTPIVTSLKPSTIAIKYIDDGSEKEVDFAIWGWIMEVSGESVRFLIDMLISVDDVDVDAAEKARADAEATMKKYKDAKDKIDMDKFIQAEDMLLKSVAKLKLGRLK